MHPPTLTSQKPQPLSYSLPSLRLLGSALAGSAMAARARRGGTMVVMLGTVIYLSELESGAATAGE